jgi:predicted nucleic acid-binding protein
MIVVDTNIILHLHVTSSQTPFAIRLLEKEPSWLSVPLWQSEFQNAMVVYIRKGMLSLPQAHLVMNEALHSMTGCEIPVASGLVLELAAASTCSATDCEFVALAQVLGVPLVTNDKQVLNEFPGITVPLQDFAGKL